MLNFRGEFRSVQDEQQNAFVHYVAKKCYLDKILRAPDEKYFKKSDADLPGYCGMAPVHFAARYGVELVWETVDFLMDQMKDPYQQDEFGNTILHHAILNSDDTTR